jgi:hypothetical protein
MLDDPTEHASYLIVEATAQQFCDWGPNEDDSACFPRQRLDVVEHYFRL